MFSRAVICSVALLLGGCVIGRTHDFQQAPLRLEARTDHSIAIGVQDLRPYVVNGDKGEDFVGLSRSGYGIPYDVRTASHRSLAQDIAALLDRALKDAGVHTRVATLPPSLGKADVKAAMTAANADRCLLLTVREWKTDTYGSTNLVYDLDLEAFDPSWKRLAEKRAQGADEMGGSAWMIDPQSHAQEAAPVALKRKLEDLYFGEIENALAGE